MGYLQLNSFYIYKYTHFRKLYNSRFPFGFLKSPLVLVILSRISFSTLLYHLLPHLTFPVPLFPSSLYTTALYLYPLRISPPGTFINFITFIGIPKVTRITKYSETS